MLGFASNGAHSLRHRVFIRNGSVIGSRDHFPRLPGETDKAKLMNGFVAQYYLGRDAPSEIILDVEIEDAEVLEEELATRAGHKVQGSSPRPRRSSSAGWRWRERMRSRASTLQGCEQRNHQTAVRALGDALGLEEMPERLECFDVSHTSGEATVASCVVFNTAGPMKSDYRRFNLSPQAAGDDYGAMAEALMRRYQTHQEGRGADARRLFVDGGKGQLAEAMRVLDELELDWLKVVAVAKGRARRPGAERLFRPGQRQGHATATGLSRAIADSADSG